MKFAICLEWPGATVRATSDADERERVDSTAPRAGKSFSKSYSERLRRTFLKIMIIFVYDICDIMGAEHSMAASRCTLAVCLITPFSSLPSAVRSLSRVYILGA